MNLKPIDPETGETLGSWDDDCVNYDMMFEDKVEGITNLYHALNDIAEEDISVHGYEAMMTFVMVEVKALLTEMKGEWFSDGVIQSDNYETLISIIQAEKKE